MSIFRLIYVSSCALNANVVRRHLEEIAIVSQFRNRDRGITGCLICCRGRFAGILEGSRNNVEMVIDQIRRDPRHEGVATLSAKDYEERMFLDWSLAYSGKSLFVAAIIERAALGAETDIARLMRAIVEFSDDKRLSSDIGVSAAV